MTSCPAPESNQQRQHHQAAPQIAWRCRVVAAHGPLHDVAAHHAADGALPITLAALEGVTDGEAAADAFYSPSGSRARSLEDAAMRLDARQLRRGDPAAWGNETVEAFWQRLVEATPGLGDAWSAAAREGQGTCEGSE